MIQLLLFLGGTWDEAKGYLREDLEHVQVALNTQLSAGSVNLANGVQGRLPFANLVAATAPSVLVGRESGSVGDFGQITLGSGLSMTGKVLSSLGSGDIAVVAARVTFRM